VADGALVSVRELLPQRVGEYNPIGETQGDTEALPCLGPSQRGDSATDKVPLPFLCAHTCELLPHKQASDRSYHANSQQSDCQPAARVVGILIRQIHFPKTRFMPSSLTGIGSEGKTQQFPAIQILVLRIGKFPHGTIGTWLSISTRNTYVLLVSCACELSDYGAWNNVIARSLSEFAKGNENIEMIFGLYFLAFLIQYPFLTCLATCLTLNRDLTFCIGVSDEDINTASGTQRNRRNQSAT
jgi:hypothetical protein